MKIKPEEKIPRTQPFAWDLRTSNRQLVLCSSLDSGFGGGARQALFLQGPVLTDLLSGGTAPFPGSAVTPGDQCLSEPRPPTPTAPASGGPWAPLPDEPEATACPTPVSAPRLCGMGGPASQLGLCRRSAHRHHRSCHPSARGRTVGAAAAPAAQDAQPRSLGKQDPGRPVLPGPARSSRGRARGPAVRSRVLRRDRGGRQ